MDRKCAFLFGTGGGCTGVMLQALMVNWLVDEFRLMSDRNWFPGLFYVLVTSILPEFLFISAPLVAATFVPISLRKVFKSYKSMQATPLVFDAALWMSVAALFYPPALMLLLAAYSGIMVMRSFQVREQLVFLVAHSPLYFWCGCGICGLIRAVNLEPYSLAEYFNCTALMSRSTIKCY